jgi:homeobox protein cut-like
LNVYKLLSDAPDPYPLLDAAVDQTVKVAEARVLESELSRLREENAELKKQVADSSSFDDKRKKAESRVDQLEAKVRRSDQRADLLTIDRWMILSRSVLLRRRTS